MPETAADCCQPFDPTPFRDAEWTWQDKLFVKDHVRSFLHVPLNLGRRVTRNMALIEAAHAASDRQLMLTDERSPWGADLFIEVAAPVPGATMTKLSGVFLTRVYDGPFRDAAKWVADIEGWLASRGETVEKLYFGYTTCPRCAKKYGHNYVVLFAQVGQEAVAAGNGP
jgi:hypothetical protein